MDERAVAAADEREARRQRDLERLEKLRVLDDTFMRQVFKDNLPLAQHVLRIVTGIGDLTLVREETQRDLKRLAGSHSVVLDVWGEDSLGNQYDLEVQGGSGLEPRRFRYYGSGMDVESLRPNRPYEELPNRWLVVVLESDPDGSGRALRHYQMREDGGIMLCDGAHLLYANAQWRGDDELGSLMADFCQSDPDKIKDSLLRERVQYLKRSDEGREHMCRISEEIYNEGLEQGLEQGARDTLVENVRSLIESVGWTAQQALDVLKVPESERARILSLL